MTCRAKGYTYQLTAETQVDDQGQVEYAFEYEYSAAHNRTVKVENGTPTYYSYNAANQMVTEVTEGETTYYHYDGCGNTTARQAPAGTTYYAYDTENLMTRIDFADGSHCYYSYDADSKRVSQRTPEGYTEFIYQGPDMLKLQMERDEDGETKVQYTMGAGLESVRRDAGGGMASGDSSFFHYNHLGTTIALTNPAESVSDTYRHDAWGVLLAQTYTGQQPTVNPHTYVGRERYYRMPEPDLYHLGFRDYGAKVGRFTTVDPVRGRSAAEDLLGVFREVIEEMVEAGYLRRTDALSMVPSPNVRILPDATRVGLRELPRRRWPSQCTTGTAHGTGFRGLPEGVMSDDYAYCLGRPTTEADPTGEFPVWAAILIVLGVYELACAGAGTVEAMIRGYVGKGRKSDKMAHCVAACVIRGCGTIVSSWFWGIVKETYDAITKHGFSKEDLAANAAGEKCAVCHEEGEDCNACCGKAIGTE